MWLQVKLSQRTVAALLLIVLFSAGFFAFFSLHVARGATITWTGNGADNNWSTPENWSTGTVPGNNVVVIFDGNTDDFPNSSKDAVIDIALPTGNNSIRIITENAYTGTISVNTPTLELGGLRLTGGTLDLNGNTLDLNYRALNPTFLKGNIIGGLNDQNANPSLRTLGTGQIISDGGTIMAESLVLSTGTFNLTGSTIYFDGNINGSGLFIGNNRYACYGNFLTNTGASEIIVSKGASADRFVTFDSFDIFSDGSAADPCIYDVSFATQNFTVEITNGSHVIVDGPTVVGRFIVNAGGNFLYQAGEGEFRTTSGFYDLTLTDNFDLSQATSIEVPRKLTVASETELEFNGTDIIFVSGLDLEGTIIDAENKNIIIGPLAGRPNSSFNTTLIPELISGNLIVRRIANGFRTFWQMSNDTTVNGDFIIDGNTDEYILNPASPYTLTVLGNVSMDLGASVNRSGGDNMILLLDGANEQTMSMDSDTRSLWDSPIVFDSDTGVRLTDHVATTSTCSLSSGYLNLNGFNLECDGGLTVNAGTTLIMQGDETVTLAGDTTAGSITYVGDNDGEIDTYTINEFASLNNLTIDATDGLDVFELSEALDVGGNVTIDSGTLDAGSATAYNMNVAGDWVDGDGVFAPRSSTVTLDGTSQAISGSTNFYRLSKTVTSPDTLTLGSGSTVAISNQLTLQGADADNQLSLRSSTPGVSASINPSGSRTISALDVQDINNANETAINCETDCTDSGNNTNWDFANPGVTLSKSTATVSENGDTDSFTIVLTTAPTHDVTIPIASNDTGEGIVDKASVTFTTGNWDTPQTVTITGVDDDLADGDVTFSIILGAITSTDPAYDGIDPGDVSVTNTNNDPATATVSAISGNTTEAGGTATFTVVLDAQPVANVVISVTSSDTTEGTVSPAQLTFATGNWDDPQTVTVTGVDDFLDDGNISYTIQLGDMVSADGAFNGETVDDVSVTNVDNDTAQLFLNKATASVNESGSTDTSVRVTSSVIPNGDIVLDFDSADTGEVANPDSITINSTNWNTGAVLTLTGVDDGVLDGDQITLISLNSITANDDAAFSALDLSDISVTTVDDEDAFTVSEISGNTNEDGAQATFTVQLTAEPTDTVSVSVSSSDTTEGLVSPTSLAFTALNWNAPQTVTVTGVDDDYEDGNKNFNINFGAANSTDARFSGVQIDPVSVTNEDDTDTAGVIVSAISGDTSEDLDTATFTVQLTARPETTARIDVSSSDTTEGTVDETQLFFFDNADWNIPQTVTVTGVEDALVDGDVDYTIVLSNVISGGAAYNGLAVDDVSVTNLDNDQPSAEIINDGLFVSENGSTDTFQIFLGESPVSEVVVLFSSSDTSEFTVSPASLTFDADNWDEAQTVTITGVNDDLVDGTQSGQVNIAIDAAASDDGYDNLVISPLAVLVSDNDEVGITIVESGGSTLTSEAGVSDSFTVVLDAQPNSAVSFDILSSDTGEVILSSTDPRWSSGTVTFDASNWDQPIIVDVSGVDDLDVDGTQNVSISFEQFTSSDLAFNGFDPDDTVTVSNTDNDTFGVTVTPLVGAVAESGSTATFAVRLQSEPTDDVVFTITLDDNSEAIATPTMLTFTPADWNSNKLVVLSAIDDLVDDGNTSNGVTLSIASDDPDYDGYTRDTFDFDFTVVDNETAQVILLQSNGSTALAEGQTDTYTVQLSTQPTDDVTIAITSADANELTVSPEQLIFTSANWNNAQTVTVRGVLDINNDSDDVIVISHVATSADANYDDIAISNINAILRNTNPNSGTMPIAPVQPAIAIVTPNPEVSINPHQPVRVAWDVVSPGSPFVRIESRVEGGSWIELSGPSLATSALITSWPQSEDNQIIEVRAVLSDLQDDLAEDSFFITISGSHASVNEGADSNMDSAPTDTLPVFPQNLREGDLVKVRGLSAVYILSADGTRKPFFNERIFFSHGLTFDDLIVIEDATLASIPLGTMVAPHEDYLLLFEGSPHVYSILDAASPFTQKRLVELVRIEDEVSARDTYGLAWKDLIISLPVSLFTHFSAR